MLCTSACGVGARKVADTVQTRLMSKQALDVIAAWQLTFEQLSFQFAATASGAAHARISAWPAYEKKRHWELLCSMCVYVQMSLVIA